MSGQSAINSRMHDQAYMKLTENLIEILAERVYKTVMLQQVDDQVFAKSLVTIYTRMSQLEVKKIVPPKFSNYFHNLTIYLAAQYPDSRCTSSDSSQGFSDSSRISPVPLDSAFNMTKTYMQRPLTLDEIEEEDLPVDIPEENKIRYHSQPRKAREISPTKNAFKNSLGKNYVRHKADDIMGKYMKMSENFSEKKGKKEDSLYFSNGIFFHLP